MEECDLIMKGGITSGVIYPKAIHRLAQHYRFRSIGGTSAGAIAAASAAAAEYRRQRSANGGDMEGFNQLNDLPNQLNRQGSKRTGSTLFELFQPQPRFKSLFWFLLSFVGNDRTKEGERQGVISRKLRKRLLIARVFWNAIVHFWIPALVGAMAGVLVGLLFAFLTLRGVAFTEHNGKPTSATLSQTVTAAAQPSVLWIVLGCFAFVGASIGAFYSIWHVFLKLPENNFGLCRGFEPAPDGKDEDGSQLTAWLYNLLQSLAGLPLNDPLTFGKLKKKKIDLRAITSNLSYGQPHQLPFGDDEPRAFFSCQEWSSMFPGTVLEYLKEHPPKRDPNYTKEAARIRPELRLTPLPETDDLPIIVAVRLSLSFPVLVSAIPLYLLDPVRREHRLAKCWFSDGGISSNFPVHFFDSPIPSRPTFAINLDDMPEEADDEENCGDSSESGRVYLPASNTDGLHPWTEIRTDDPQAALTGFFMAIFNVLQNWRDNALLRHPAYRDRVATIRLKPHEGGLNLNMPAKLVNTLSQLGAEAADKLVLHFLPANAAAREAFEIETGWENHRWVRLLSTLAGLERLVAEFEMGWVANPSRPTRSYRELLDPRATSQDELPSYRRFSKRQRQLALCYIDEFPKFVTACQNSSPTTNLVQDTPPPPMNFRLTSLSKDR